ncbi:PadR family transcriptional regulator [Candidatus Woesearchaeota archaeon]|nr:PadR family transcriptional regulator [Candidatus Woesearchaeota archaeon]
MPKTAKKGSKKQSPDSSNLLELKGFLSFLLLHELKLKPAAGDDLAVRIGKRRGEPLTAGTIYPTLKRLRKLKLIKYKRFGRKKVYELTDTGGKEIESLYGLFGHYFYGLKRVFRSTAVSKKKKAIKKSSKPIGKKSKK